MAAKYALCIVAAVAAALRRAALRIDVAISDAAALLCAAAALLLLQSCNFYDISFACGASRQKEIKHNSAAWQGQTEGQRGERGLGMLLSWDVAATAGGGSGKGGGGLHAHLAYRMLTIWRSLLTLPD